MQWLPLTVLDRRIGADFCARIAVAEVARPLSCQVTVSRNRRRRRMLVELLALSRLLSGAPSTAARVDY